MAVILDKQKYVQIGDQGAGWATNAAPTVELSGITDITMKKSIVTEIVQAQRGGIVPGRDTLNLRHEVDGCSVAGHVIYEQIPYFLQGLAEDAVPEVGPPKVWVYTAPTTAQPVPQPQTLVSGPENLEYGITGMCIRSITFTWNWGEGLMFSADLMGRDVVVDTFADLAETAEALLTYALASQLTVGVDALAGTIGDTPISEVQSGSITIDCQRKYIRQAGSLYPYGIFDDFWNVTGEVVFENTATTGGYVDAVVAGATTKLLEFAFTNAGAGVLNRSLVFQMASEVSFEELWSDSDGMSVVRMSFKPIEEGDWTTAPGGDLDGYFNVKCSISDAALY